MNNYLMAEQEIENDVKENNLNIVEGWSAEELARVFALNSEEKLIAHAKEENRESSGPNYFLVGGPYLNYNTAI